MNLKPPYIALLPAKPGSGKSHAIRYLLAEQQEKPFGERWEIVIVFSKTKFNDSYSYLPDSWIHQNYKESVIKTLMKIQAQCRKQNRKQLSILIIFDDCLNNQVYQNSTFQDLIANHRHFNFSIIFATQYLNRTTPIILRESTSYVLCFKQFGKNSQDAIYSAWGSLYMTRDEFNEKMKQLGDHKFLMINLRTDDIRFMKCPANIIEPCVPYLPNIVIDALPLIN